MKRGRLGIWAVAVCAMVGILLTFAASVAAQELVTDAERLWRDLRSSSDVRTKLLAERWYHAVKLQEWSNDTGKFTTNAKYLDHDPNLGWVKLRVIQGTGRERVVKEVTIPLAKLSKTCQARVRQIHTLSAKLAEAKVEEEKRQAEEKDGAPTSDVRSSEMPAEEPVGDRAGNLRDRRGRGEFADESASVNPEDTLTQGPRAERSEPSVPSMPLPALSPSLPTTRIALAMPKGPPTTSPETSAVPTGDEAWRTSYDAFRANIQVQDQGRGNYTFQWGPMQALQHAYEVNKRWEDTGDVGQEALAEIGAALDAVGEVNWEATLKAVPAADGDWNEALELPALPEPWELTFMLDEQQDPAVLATLKPGDRVRFTGRFEAFDDSNSIVVPIRFAASELAAAGARLLEQRMAVAAPSPVGFAPPTPLADTPNLIDQDPWRTDYETFRSVFERDADGIVSTRERWAGLLNLQLFTPIPILQAQERGEPPVYMAEPRLVEVGGFQWEGVVAQQPSGDANWAEVLGLAPLVEPLKLELRLEDGGQSGDWQRLQLGDRVRFVGQFVGYRGPYGWVAAIRLLPDASERR